MSVLITNPKGETKAYSNKEYEELLWKFTESKTFQSWENNKNLGAVFWHNGKKTLNYIVFGIFFKEYGYKVIKNVELKETPKIIK